MKLMFETEYWLAEIQNVIDLEEERAGITLSDDHYADIARALRSRVISRLFFDHGVDAKWSYQQSVGALVLVQSATDTERCALIDAVDAEREWVTDQVQKEIDAEQSALASGGE